MMDFIDEKEVDRTKQEDVFLPSHCHRVPFLWSGDDDGSSRDLLETLVKEGIASEFKNGEVELSEGLRPFVEALVTESFVWSNVKAFKRVNAREHVQDG